MNIALLITTRNRNAYIKRLLDSLVEQQEKNFTLFIGLQEPDRETQSLVEKYKFLFPMHVYTLPLCSLSKARNILMQYNTCDIVGFPDDDCFYLPNTTAEVEASFTTHRNMGICIANGLLTPYLRQEPASAPTIVSRYMVLKNAPSWVLFFRRAIIEQVGTFDENMGLGAPTLWQSGEETDFVLRAIDLGASAFRIKSVQIVHPPHQDTLQASSKWRSYSAGRIFLLAKHGFSLWFALLNVLYPLFSILREPPRMWRYRRIMFSSRLYYFLQLYVLRGKLHMACPKKTDPPKKLT